MAIDMQLVRQASEKAASLEHELAHFTNDPAGGMNRIAPAAGRTAAMASLLGLLPLAGSAAGAVGGLSKAPTGRLLPGLARGVNTGATAGVGGALGGAAGGGLSALLAHLMGADPDTASKVGVGGAVAGAGAGGYGGYRLGKYLNWDDMGTEEQPKPKPSKPHSQTKTAHLIRLPRLKTAGGPAYQPGSYPANMSGRTVVTGTTPTGAPMFQGPRRPSPAPTSARLSGSRSVPSWAQALLAPHPAEHSALPATAAKPPAAPPAPVNPVSVLRPEPVRQPPATAVPMAKASGHSKRAGGPAGLLGRLLRQPAPAKAGLGAAGLAGAAARPLAGPGLGRIGAGAGAASLPFLMRGDAGQSGSTPAPAPAAASPAAPAAASPAAPAAASPAAPTGPTHNRPLVGSYVPRPPAHYATPGKPGPSSSPSGRLPRATMDMPQGPDVMQSTRYRPGGNPEWEMYGQAPPQSVPQPKPSFGEDFLQQLLGRRQQLPPEGQLGR